MKRLLLGIVGLLLAVALAISVLVQSESPYRLETLSPSGTQGRALILYHPSRDAHFSDELSMAVAAAFQQAGLAVDRATMTRQTPARPDGYRVVAVISNTYYWSPDLPTLHYLERADFRGLLVLGFMGGAGSTGRAERLLGQALHATHGTVYGTRSFWVWRPNDETRKGVPNRRVAAELAAQFVQEALGAATTPEHTAR